MVQTSDELLTVKEAARLLKVSPYTIYRWVSSGRLRAVRYSPRVLRLRRSDVETLPSPGRTSKVTPRKGSPAAILAAAGLIRDREFLEITDDVVRNRTMADFKSPFDELSG